LVWQGYKEKPLSDGVHGLEDVNSKKRRTTGVKTSPEQSGKGKKENRVSLRKARIKRPKSRRENKLPNKIKVIVLRREKMN